MTEPDLDHVDWQSAAETLRVLAHPLRLRMLRAMADSVRTVGSLAQQCEVQNHQASEHLRLMQRLGLVKSHRQGRFTYYRLDNEHLRQVLNRVEDWFAAAPLDVTSGSRASASNGDANHDARDHENDHASDDTSD